MRDVTYCRWLLRQQASRPIGAPMRDADELDDAGEPLLVEISHRVVAKKLSRREQSGLRVHLAVSDGVVVRRHGAPTGAATKLAARGRQGPWRHSPPKKEGSRRSRPPPEPSKLRGQP